MALLLIFAVQVALLFVSETVNTAFDMQLCYNSLVNHFGTAWRGLVVPPVVSAHVKCRQPGLRSKSELGYVLFVVHLTGVIRAYRVHRYPVWARRTLLGCRLAREDSDDFCAVRTFHDGMMGSITTDRCTI